MSRWFAMVPIEGQAIAGDLGLHALRVYIAICVFSGRDGHSRCSQHDIAQNARIKDRRHISRAVALLIEAKLIERTHCRSNAGGNAANSYRVIHIAAHTLAPVEAQPPAPVEAQPPAPVEAQPPAPVEAQQRDTKKTISQNDDEKGARVVVPFGRSAPFLHSGEAPLAKVEPSRKPVRDPSAYDSAVKAGKRRNWLSWINSKASTTLRGGERDAAWEAIAEASQAETREATPKRSRQLLDALDKRFRAERERARRHGSERPR